MAKLTKRFTAKGSIKYEEGIFVEYHKDLGEIHHGLDEIFEDFEGLDDVTLTLAFDEEILD